MSLPLHPGRRSGFTLIEIMLAVAIIVFLMGGLFGTVRATVKASATMRDAQQARNGIDGIFELCQQTFPELPVHADLVWANRESGGMLPELELHGAPKAFAVGAHDFSFGEIALTTRRQANGGITLGIEYRKTDPQTGKTVADPLWLPLMIDLQHVAWSFYDPQTGKWSDQWDQGNRHPALIRLTLVVMGDSQEWTQTFWLPKLTMPRPLTAQQGADAAASLAPSSP